MNRNNNSMRRLSKKEVDSWPAPPKVTRRNVNEVSPKEPDDIWVSATDHEKSTGWTPEVDGIPCEWVTRKNGERVLEGHQRTAPPRA